MDARECPNRKGALTRRAFVAAGAAMAAVGVLGAAGCASTTPDAGTDAGDGDDLPEASLRIIGSKTGFKALEHLCQQFTQKYPKCNVVYEYLQGFNDNAPTRLGNTEDVVDMFLTNNIQEGSSLQPFALDLYEEFGDDLDLSGTHEGLVVNYEYKDSSAADGAKAKLYSIPYGGELRGMFVNKTLLGTLGIDVPATRTELLDACQKLFEAGYTPLQGNPGNFAQLLLYPYICSLIVNADDPQAVRDRVSAREPGLSEMFADPFSFLYDLVEKRYYEYKKVETELGLFTDISDDQGALSFLNIVEDDGGTMQKRDDVGLTAFMPGQMSIETYVDQAIEDYHSDIEYEFVLAPASDDAPVAYFSPAMGVAVNKNTPNTAWALRFLNFLFDPENNRQLAEENGTIPNTADAFDFVKGRFDVPDAHIIDVGQVTFGYDFYDVVFKELVTVSKANNPKYMETLADGTQQMYSLQTYMDELEAAFVQTDAQA